MVAGGGVYPRSVCSRNSEIGTPSTGSLLLTAKISAIVPSKPCRVNGKEVPLASAALPRVPAASPIKIAVFVLAGPLVHAPNDPVRISTWSLSLVARPGKLQDTTHTKSRAERSMSRLCLHQHCGFKFRFSKSNPHHSPNCNDPFVR